MRSAAAAPFCLLQVLEVNQGEGRKLTRCKADPKEATFDEARLLRLVNRQDHQAPTVGPCKTCPHPQHEFLEFLQFLCGCVLVQPFSAVHSGFCSVSSSFPPFVRVLFSEIEVSAVCLGFNW